jgi:DNA polymerase III subunit epsilon
MFKWPWSWFRARDIHPVLRNTYGLFAHFDQSRPIEDYEFVSFDTELTGLNPRRDTIVSIGAVRIRNLQIVVGDNFFTYVHPGRDLPKDSTLIHRITPDQIENAPQLRDVLPAFVEYCGTSLLLGHYVTLDMAFVGKAMREILGAVIRNPCVDSMKLAQTYYEHRRRSQQKGSGGQPSYALKHLAQEYDLPLFAQHDALEDALQTAYLFIYLVRSLKEIGFVTLKDFYRAGR